MTTLSHILNLKGSQTWSVKPSDTVYDAIKKMSDNNIGALIVLEDEKLVGIITERHYARNVFLKGRASPHTHVGDIMERNVVCAHPDATVEECMAVMTAKRVRHLPIVRGGTLLGIVSIGDLAKAIISDKEFTIDQLEHFIQG
jgi:CBS domain-containing protein